MSETDPFRFCVYCNADCKADAPEHTAECPFNTGLFPVRDEELGPTCSNCGHKDGMCCSACMQPFAVGDFYVHRNLASGEVGANLAEAIGATLENAPIYEPVCLSCGAQIDGSEGGEQS